MDPPPPLSQPIKQSHYKKQQQYSYITHFKININKNKFFTSGQNFNCKASIYLDNKLSEWFCDHFQKILLSSLERTPFNWPSQ